MQATALTHFGNLYDKSEGATVTSAYGIQAITKGPPLQILTNFYMFEKSTFEDHDEFHLSLKGPPSQILTQYNEVLRVDP